MIFVLTDYFSETYNITLGEVELFTAHLTDPSVKSVKLFYFDLTLAWHVTLILKC